MLTLQVGKHECRHLCYMGRQHSIMPKAANNQLAVESVLLSMNFSGTGVARGRIPANSITYINE